MGDVRAVFSRRYLHQNKALEIFFSNRCECIYSQVCVLYICMCVEVVFLSRVCPASVFLVFETPRVVREVVKRLPKVGAGAEYHLPQTRSTLTPSHPHTLTPSPSHTHRHTHKQIDLAGAAADPLPQVLHDCQMAEERDIQFRLSNVSQHHRRSNVQ